MNDRTLDTNSLLQGGDLPNFTDFRAAEIESAIRLLIARCEDALETLLQQASTAKHQGIAELLDIPMEALGEAWGTVVHLHAVLDTPELRAAVAVSQPLVTAFYARLSSDDRLYALYKRVHREQADSLGEAQRKALENRLRDFRLAGAELDAPHKARFVEAQQRLAELSRNFSNHVLDATDAFVHWASADELDGVPEQVLASLGAAAAAEGPEGLYKLSLQQPCLGPLMQYARRRKLRETLYKAMTTRASEFGPPDRDNGPVIAEIMALRQERAELLGLGSHAELSLIPKMADSPEQVMSFLRDLSRQARAQAAVEFEQLKTFARLRLNLDVLEAWDVGFVSESLRQERYAFSEEEVRSHFRLEAVIAGMFELAQQLFDVTLLQEALPAWHPSVTGYRVERHGELLGRFYLDPFARTGKNGGAWMNGLRPRWRKPDGQLRTAVACLVTNFAAPVDGQPTLLRHGEVVTIFHEFGHGLHFLLSEVEVLGVSGISGVEWDAVELPSQLMENFAWQWPVVERLTNDLATGRSLPRELFDKMIAARNFQGGLGLLRQVELALFDMRLHAEPALAGDVQALLDEVRSEVALMKAPSYNRFQNAFSHIFAGGYAAGYFCYLWAEVLACDAWEAFEEAGATAAAIGQRYMKSILSRGGSRSMRENFEGFRGRQPSIEALLRQRGLTDAAAV